MLTTSLSPLIVEGLLSSAYAVEYRSRRKKSYRSRSPVLYDKYDKQVSNDFSFLLDSLFDNILNDIESDLLSVWSTNRSE